MPTKLLGLIILGVVGFFATVMATLTMTAGFTYRHPRNPDARIVDVDGRLIVMKKEEPLRNADSPDGFPRVEVDETTHDFGILPPHTTVTHAFTIRNTGEAPLELTKGETSCKCTFAGVPNGAVPPGGEAKIELTWNTGRIDQYQQTAEIRTNDPQRPRLSLTVKGKIDIRIAVEPEGLVMPRLEPGKSYTSQLLVYSRTWDDFQVEDLQCTLPGAVLKVEPADAETLYAKDAKSGRLITVQAPGMEPGRFNGAIRANMIPASASEDTRPHPINVPISGKVLRRLSLYGPAIDSTGEVSLGETTQGTPLSTTLLARVKDEQKDLKIREIKTVPDFIQVELNRKEEAPAGSYDLTVRIPDDAPSISYLGSRIGSIKILFDHPRIKTLELRVSFAVLAEE